MDVLWDTGAATIRDIINRLGTDPAYTTIATVLANLQRKELVTSHKEKHTTRYTARTSREEHDAALMNHVLGSSRDRAASMLHFVESIPDSDLDLLRDYLLRREEGPKP